MALTTEKQGVPGQSEGSTQGTNMLSSAHMATGVNEPRAQVAADFTCSKSNETKACTASAPEPRGYSDLETWKALSRGTTLDKLKSEKELESGVLHPLLWGRSAGASESPLKDPNPGRNGLG